MTETRKENRLQVELVVRYREPSMAESREAAAQDLALGGMFVLTPRPSPRGALLSFECIASGPADKFTGTARVIWQRNKTDPRGPAGMGVRFIRLEPGSREAVMRLIEQSSAQSGAKGPSSRPPPRKSIPPVEVARPLSISGAPISLDSTRPGGGTDSISRGLRVPTLRNVTVESPSNSSSSLPPSSAAARAEPSILRERLDRTRRGMPPTAESGDATRAVSTPQPARPLSGTLLGVGRKSERPPSPGGVDDLRPLIPIPVRKLSDPPEAQTSSAPSAKPSGHTRRVSSQTMLEINSSRPPPKSSTPPPPSSGPTMHAAHSEPASEAPPKKPSSTPPPRAPHADFEAEPVVDLGDARRQPFRAPFDAAIELPNPERGRKGSRWLAWTVIGGGIAFSLLLGVVFGGGAVRLPEQLGEAEGTTPSALDPAPATAPNADLQPPRPVGTAIPYALDVETQPSGARVSAAGRFIMAPGRLELGALSGTTTVTAELAGYRTTALDVVPREFALDDGVYVRRLLIALPQEAVKDSVRAPAPAAPTTAHKPKSTQAGTPSSQTASAPILVSPPPGAASPTPAPAGDSPLDRARACLSQGDNACVVRELEDKASTAAEMEMLIETYRAIGSSARAEQRMHQYLERFPNGKRAAEYTRRLNP